MNFSSYEAAVTVRVASLAVAGLMLYLPVTVALPEGGMMGMIVPLTVQLITSVLVIDVYSLLPAPAFALHDCPPSRVTVAAVPPIVILALQVLVRLMVPLPELAAGMEEICRNHGTVEVAVHVMSGTLSTVPAGATLQFLLASPPPYDTLVSVTCVCVMPT
jgi:hypothetical protein